MFSKISNELMNKEGKWERPSKFTFFKLMGQSHYNKSYKLKRTTKFV